jgi:hypothetical protein
VTFRRRVTVPDDRTSAESAAAHIKVASTRVRELELVDVSTKTKAPRAEAMRGGKSLEGLLKITCVRRKAEIADACEKIGGTDLVQ